MFNMFNNNSNKQAVLLEGAPRDDAVNFDTYQSLFTDKLQH